MIAPRVTDSRPFAAVLISLIGLCWLALLLWGTSPHRRFLSHDVLDELGGRITFEYLGIALIFVVAWVLMTAAMMLPTALPLLLLFQRFVSTRGDRWAVTGAVIAGYLATWGTFGIAAHLGDLVVHTAVAQSHWLEDRSWLLATVTLAIAGAYQFSPLKYFCLEKCRSPFSFVVEHWHGRTPKRDALRLGFDHGVYCVGCCWSLMLLMFAVGIGNIAWMLALGIVMAAEKNLAWGHRLSTPLGVVLLGAALGLLAGNLGVSPACAHDGGGC